MEKVVLEHVLSLMPPATQIRVRETKPKTEKEACDLADNMARARKVTNEAVSHGDKRDAKGDTPKGQTSNDFVRSQTDYSSNRNNPPCRKIVLATLPKPKSPLVRSDVNV